MWQNSSPEELFFTQTNKVGVFSKCLLGNVFLQLSLKTQLLRCAPSTPEILGEGGHDPAHFCRESSRQRLRCVPSLYRKLNIAATKTNKTSKSLSADRRAFWEENLLLPPSGELLVTRLSVASERRPCTSCSPGITRPDGTHGSSRLLLVSHSRHTTFDLSRHR